MYYLQGLGAGGKIRFHSELALTYLPLAELLFEGTDAATGSEVLEHLDLAIPELQDMNMQPGHAPAALREGLTPAAAGVPARESASDVLTPRELRLRP